MEFANQIKLYWLRSPSVTRARIKDNKTEPTVVRLFWEFAIVRSFHPWNGMCSMCNAQLFNIGHDYLKSLPDFESEKQLQHPHSTAFQKKEERCRMENNNRNTALDIHPENMIKMRTSLDVQLLALCSYPVSSSLFDWMHGARSTMHDARWNESQPSVKFSTIVMYCSVYYNFPFQIFFCTRIPNSWRFGVRSIRI